MPIFVASVESEKFRCMINRNRIFLGAMAVLLLANLLVMNDFTSLWEGAESFLAWRALHGEAGSSPQEWIMALSFGSGQVPHFTMRLPGAIVFLLTLGAYWLMSERLFGREVALTTLLLAAASLLLPNMAKVAAGDIWAMGSQWLAFTAMLRYLKQPKLSWRLSFYGLFFFAIWIQAANSLVFLLGSSAFLYFAHPQGRRLWGLNPWLFGLAAAGLLYTTQLISFSNHSFVVGFHSGRFLLWNLIGVLPFAGFVVAGIWETGKQARRREELALVNTAALLFALAGHSLALQGLLAALAARQAIRYFDANYPFRPIVKTTALLHLLFAFFAIMALMIGSFLQFGGLGFRSAIAGSLTYWMSSFVAVLGMFGEKRDYVLGGTALSGMLLILLFWLQLNPLLESKRDWPRELVKQAADKVPQEREITAFLLLRDSAAFPALAPYTKAVFPKTVLLDNRAQLEEAWAGKTKGLFLLEKEVADSLNPGLASAIRADSVPLVVKGWNTRLRAQEYTVLLKD